MKSFIAFLVALILGTAFYGSRKSKAITGSEEDAKYGELKGGNGMLQYPEENIEDDIVFGEDIAEIGQDRKLYYQQSKLQRQVDDNQRRRAKKSSKKSSSDAGDAFVTVSFQQNNNNLVEQVVTFTHDSKSSKRSSSSSQRYYIPTNSNFGTNAPVISYLANTQSQCQAIANGQSVAIFNSSRQSYSFSFRITLGQVYSAVSIAALVQAALQELAAQQLANCSSRRRLKNHKRGILNKNQNLHHKQWRRHLMAENIVEDVQFDSNCVEVEPCETPGACFECGTTVEIYLKGPTTDQILEQEISSIIDSPTFIAQAGLGDIARTFEASSVEATTTTQVGGDPHIVTWKGEHYEYHGQCDMVMVKDNDFANGLGLDVHIRTKLVRFWSYIKNVSIRIGHDVLEIEGDTDIDTREGRYWFNYEYRGELTDIAGFPVTYSSSSGSKSIYEIDLDSAYPGAKIMIKIYKEFIRVQLFGKDNVYGNSVGLLGDYYTGQTLGRDGVTVFNDFSKFASEWQVLAADPKLFHTLEIPQFPEKCLEPDNPQGDRRRRLGEGNISEEEAEQACASLKDPLTIKDCVYDILATQDLDMVGAF